MFGIMIGIGGIKRSKIRFLILVLYRVISYRIKICMWYLNDRKKRVFILNLRVKVRFYRGNDF